MDSVTVETGLCAYKTCSLDMYSEMAIIMHEGNHGVSGASVAVMRPVPSLRL